jgi:hypothetical protein
MTHGTPATQATRSAMLLLGQGSLCIRRRAVEHGLQHALPLHRIESDILYLAPPRTPAQERAAGAGAQCRLCFLSAVPEHPRDVKISCCRRSNRRCRSNSFVLLVESANACLSAMAQNSRRQRQLLRCIPARSGTLPEAERNLAPAPGHV